MLENTRKTVIISLKRHISAISKDKEELNKKVQELNDKYKMPADMAAQLLSMYLDTSLQPDSTLFCLMSIFDEKKVPMYFSENEIKKYSQINYEKQKKKLKFKMIQIEEDQWIGKISVKDICELANNNMIHYEETMQRPMTLVTKNGNEYYKPTLSNVAVQKITESYRTEKYIPNTITLNVPIEQGYPEYDEETCTLSVNDIDYFDIIDGYHRYVAMIRLANELVDFDYTMELRITSFTVEKARQFIWQEDQKTKMTKLQSRSFNVNTLNNRVTTILEDKGGLLKGIIGKNKIIESYMISAFLNVFFEKIDKKDETKKIIEVSKRIADKLEELIMYDPEVIDNKWDYPQVIALEYCVLHNIQADRFYEILEKVREQKIYNYERTSSNILKRLESVIGGV